MPAISTYSPTGDPYVDGVLSGVKWAVNSLTFSFPTDPAYYGTGYGSGEPSSGFEAFNLVQQNAVRAVLAQYSAVANLTFTEVAETATQHGDLRYAESDGPSTAWAYYPTTSATGGDAWFNHSGGYYNNPALGNYAWLTMLHETGHTLGLKHTHETKGSFGVLPVDHDSLEYSVMSYRSFVGGPTSGYTNSSSSFPQSLMMHDIAALQKLYGANYTTNGGDTVYSWSATSGQMSINGAAQALPAGNKVFLTLWDGGGHDTYNLSNYTGNLSVSLEPGQWTTLSATQLASLGSGHLAAGNVANALLYQGNAASLIEDVIGGAGSDTITGNTADNTLTGGAGNDLLDGHGGTNSAVYSGLSANYSWLQGADGSWTVVDLRLGGLDGIDTLVNIQMLKFTDSTITIGTVVQPPPPPPPPPPPSNTAPTAVNDSYATKVNTAITVAGSGVLGNDTDADGNALAAILVSGPSHGTLSLKADGSLVYTPTKNYSGADSFTYKANDGLLDSNLATVSINVKQTPGGGKKGGGAGSDTGSGDGTHDQGHHGDPGIIEDQIPSWLNGDGFSFPRHGHASRSGGDAPILSHSADGGGVEWDESGHHGSRHDAHSWGGLNFMHDHLSDVPLV